MAHDPLAITGMVAAHPMEMNAATAACFNDVR
jgi:hypothetical protein